MSDKGARPDIVEIPDNPEFWFLRDYPPLIPEQQAELKAVIMRFRRWEELGLSRKPGGAPVIVGDEGAAFFDYVREMEQFKSRHGFTEPPSDPIAAVSS